MSVYHDVDWSLVSFEKPKRVDPAAPVVAADIKLDTSACPHCGKALKPRGRHFHIRACKGKP